MLIRHVLLSRYLFPPGLVNLKISGQLSLYTCILLVFHYIGFRKDLAASPDCSRRRSNDVSELWRPHSNEERQETWWNMFSTVSYLPHGTALHINWHNLLWKRLKTLLLDRLTQIDCVSFYITFNKNFRNSSLLTKLLNTCKICRML